MTLDNTNDRQLYLALRKEESEVTASSGFRNGFKHIMVIVSADAWTGTNVLGSSTLSAVQTKYDMVGASFSSMAICKIAANSQVTIFTYAAVAKSYCTLAASGSNRTILTSSIQAMTLDNTNDRQLYLALRKEESEVTASSGFRSGFKHIMVIVSADAWTGTSVLGSSTLSAVQAKYDMVLAVGFGAKAVQNQAAALQQLTGVPRYDPYFSSVTAPSNTTVHHLRGKERCEIPPPERPLQQQPQLFQLKIRLLHASCPRSTMTSTLSSTPLRQRAPVTSVR
ncbi:hypothetical protein ANCCAN_20287 [Ancylostoma caninum]|uniref:VWFA domain-containing protein n=1 Tax=Ancylostoma caninum TaxID=29170 RepID=A0A368FNW8_ANCCA|nr:hypothetical protein ANCCAN_20287 [Ancylostoma caninum]